MQETRKISELKNWQDNPREASKTDMENLRWGLNKYGMLTPLLILDDGTVIGGNHRLDVLREMGVKDAWVNVVHPKNKAEMIEIAMLDNQQTANWINDKLAELVNKYKDDIDIERIKIETKSQTLDEILREFSPDEIIEDEVPEVSDEPAISKLGEVYQLGRHRLMCGDSTKIEDVEKLMNGQKADMVFTDPPYGVNYASKNEFLNNQDKGNRIQVDIENDTMTLDETSEFIYKCFVNIRLFLAEKSSYYITAPQGGDLLMMMMMMQKANIPLRHMLIWVKNNHVLGRTDYNYKHEPILFGWIKTHNFYGKGDWQFSTWEIDKPLKNDLHPTMKPIALMVNAILNSTLKDNIVLDLFGGSGSTLIACEQTDRTCYMMELDPKYCDVIRKRYDNFINANNTGIKQE